MNYFAVVTFIIRLVVYTSTISILILKSAEHIEAGNVLVHSHDNKVLVGHSYRNISHLKPGKCLEYCLADCLCLSFQTCDSQPCQLCDVSYEMFDPAASFQHSENCDHNYFKYHDATELATGQCNHGCMRDINCCLTSIPCYHSGTCVPSSSSEGQRFTCKCPDNYEGERCEKKRCKPGYKGKNCQTRIRSCNGYKGGRRRSAGTYTIIDNADNPYLVFCVFSTNKDFAWTLIQSYTLENKNKFDKPLMVNHPVNENQPSWVEYRLSKVRMDWIRSFPNTHWRITCNYDNDGFTPGSDLVRAQITTAPLFNNAGKRCYTVEYINIRGHKCNNCRVFMVNDGTHPLYFDPRRSGQECDLDVTNTTMCGNQTENSFGYYQCTNPAHHCSSSPTATTQIWLGGV